MKTWQKIAIGAVVAVALILSIVFYATSGITKTADDFFAAARSGDFEAAHALTSKSLRARTSPERLEAFLNQNGLEEIMDSSWSSRSMEGSVGSLEGTLTTVDEATIPVKIGLVHEEDVWRIHTIDLAGGGVQAAVQDVLPSPEIQQALVKQETRRLIAAIQNDDPQMFLDAWVEEADESVLGSSFATLRPALPGMVPLADDTPDIIEANIAADGVMTLVGRFEDEAHVADAMFKFIERGNDEKIVAFNYQIDPKPEAGADER